MTETLPGRQWHEIEPKDAMELDLSKRLDIRASLNELGERCPWPWGPQQLVGVPLGQYHCEYCGAMCVAGVPHLDYAEDPEASGRGSDERPDQTVHPGACQ